MCSLKAAKLTSSDTTDQAATVLGGLEPNRTVRDFRASKSVNRRFFSYMSSSMNGLWGSEFAKCSVMRMVSQTKLQQGVIVSEEEKGKLRQVTLHPTFRCFGASKTVV